MSRTNIDICNRALARIGSDVQLASLDDDNAEAEVCAREYSETFAAALTVPGGKPMRWSFATTQKALTRLASVPVARYAYAYQIEANTLVLHAILVNSIPIEFTRLDDMVYCDAPSDVVAEYTFQPDEAALPSFFADALATDLAAKLALGLNRDMELANMLSRQAMDQWAAARAADSQARSSRRVRANRLRVSRFG